ncbi:MAG: ATP phosphoribosyltransferase regulatory subunit [Pseudomonadota bacterium]
MIKRLLTPIPVGTKDILPSEAAELRFLEDAVRSVFDAFGYSEVRTPTLELESVMERAGESRFRRSFRLFGENGEMLMLRPDMTAPLARMVATRLEDREPPFRLCYFADSFRPTRPQRGRQSEFYQAGLELIGEDSPGVDAEVIAIACQALAASGLRDYSLVLGEASFFRALLDELRVGEEGREAIFSSMAARDMVELRRAVDGLGLSGEDSAKILDVVSLRGGSEVLTAASDLVSGEAMDAALKRLTRTYYLVSRYGFAPRVLFDLGILRNFDYYTGIVFEVLSGEIGFPIGGGGRYDRLLGRFGRDLPAVGFAVGLDRLHIAVTEEGGVSLPERPGVALAGGLDQLLDLARELREAGVRVLALDAKTEPREVIRLAAEAGLPLAAVPAGEDFQLMDAASRESVTLSRGELVERVIESP